jgi:hypothetical protein
MSERAGRGEVEALKHRAPLASSLPKARAHWPWVIAIIVLTAVFFYPLVFQGKVFSSPDAQAPQGFAVYAERERAQTGEYPLWNPFIFCGLPSYAALAYNPDVYFPDWILKPLTSVTPPMLWLIAYYMVGAIGLYFLARDRGAAPGPAALGGLLFALTPNLIAVGAHGHGSQLVNSGLIPVVLLALHRWLSRGRIVWLALLALTIGAQILRGHVQIAYYTWLAVLGYLVFYLLDRRRPSGLFTLAPARALTGVVAALTVGAALGAVLALPVFAYAPYSIRGGGPGGGVSFDYATGWSLGLAELGTLFVPAALGFGGETYWGTMPFTDYPNYMGILTLGLAACAFLRSGTPPRGARGATAAVAPGLHPGYFLALAVFGLVVALGKHFPIYQLFYELLPGWKKFRVPVMVLVLTQLGTAVLAAIGLTRLVSLAGAATGAALGRRFQWVVLAGLGLALVTVLAAGPIQDRVAAAFRSSPRISAQYAGEPERARTLGILAAKRCQRDLVKGAVLVTLGAALGWLALTRKIRSDVLVGGMAVLSAADLVPIDRTIMNPLIAPRSALELPAEPDPIARFLLAQSGPFRILPIEEFASNRFATWGIASAGGYHAAKPVLYQNFMTAVGLDDLSLFRHPERLRILDLLNVRFLVTGLTISESERFRLALDGPIKAYENRFAGPRTFLAGRVRVEPNPEAALGQLLNPSFQLDREAIVAEDPGPVGAMDVTGTATITRALLNQITVEVASSGPALLVLGELDSPGWQATVDGRAAKIVRTDLIFRGVAVSEGAHRVEFRYLTPGLRAGRWLSIGAAILIGCAFLGSLGGRFRRPAAG